MPSFRIRAFQGGPRHSEPGSGLGDDPTRLSQHSDDMLPLHLLQRAVAGEFECIGPYFGQRSTEVRASREDDRPFNEVFELSYIARPRPTHQGRIVSDGIFSICLFISRAYFWVKCRASTGISSQSHAQSVFGGIEQSHMLADGLGAGVTVNALGSCIPSHHIFVPIHQKKSVVSPAPLPECRRGRPRPALPFPSVRSCRAAPGGGALATRSPGRSTQPPAGFHRDPRWSVPSCSPRCRNACHSSEI
jgi:hypothetical protein